MPQRVATSILVLTDNEHRTIPALLKCLSNKAHALEGLGNHSFGTNSSAPPVMNCEELREHQSEMDQSEILTLFKSNHSQSFMTVTVTSTATNDPLGEKIVTVKTASLSLVNSNVTMAYTLWVLVTLSPRRIY